MCTRLNFVGGKQETKQSPWSNGAYILVGDMWQKHKIKINVISNQNKSLWANVYVLYFEITSFPTYSSDFSFNVLAQEKSF